MTSSIRASADSPARSTAARMATRAELDRRHARERTAELADGRPGGADDEGVTVRSALWLHAAEGTPRPRGDRRRVDDRRRLHRTRGPATPTTPELVARPADARAGLPRRRRRPRPRQPAGRDPRLRLADRRRRADPDDLRTDARLLREEADRTYRLVSTLLDVARIRAAGRAPHRRSQPTVAAAARARGPSARGRRGRGRDRGDLPEVEVDPSALRNAVAGIAGRGARAARRPVGPRPAADRGCGRARPADRASASRCTTRAAASGPAPAERRGHRTRSSIDSACPSSTTRSTLPDRLATGRPSSCGCRSAATAGGCRRAAAVRRGRARDLAAARAGVRRRGVRTGAAGARPRAGRLRGGRGGQRRGGAARPWTTRPSTRSCPTTTCRR